MKNKFASVVFALILTACGSANVSTPLPSSAVETAVIATLTQQAAAQLPSATPESAMPEGNTYETENISFLIPNGIATDATSALTSEYEYPYINPSVGDMAPHLKFTLNAYELADTLLKPQIILFHAEAYAQYSEYTATTINLLQNLQYVDGQPLPEPLAGQLFTAQIHRVDFQNSRGVRYLTQVAQAIGPANNHEMFYYFQGVTNDGKYFVQAILPINAPFLASNNSPDAPLPADGIPLNESDFTGYLNAITEKLNATDTFSFAPYLDHLDALVESIQVKGY
ncbi:MAG: hypothetical protein IT311_08425 [Anaerolineales bacterium]|nr:hypothetical protein [Anaerolineales bacterium]